MGGTSTDVSHFAGRYELGDENLIAGVRIRAPMMQIHTIAAGGGSICRFDGMRFRVGPESAGARPGPACYRGGGPLTVTDCNLFLGRISAEIFQPCLGRTATSRSIRRHPGAKLQEVADALGGAKSLEEIAEGFCPSPWTIWQRRSARSRSLEAMTSPVTHWPASGVRAASMLVA